MKKTSKVTLKPSDELIALKWYDAQALLSSSLEEAIQRGLTINVTYGKIKYIDKHILIICTEESCGASYEKEPDLTIIPRRQVIGKE